MEGDKDGRYRNLAAFNEHQQLYGDDMVRIAHWLAKQSYIDALYCSKQGLHCGRHNAFFHFPKEYRKLTLLVGATQPSFNPADSEFYPPQLLATTDYPGALLLQENCTRCIHFSLP